MQGRISELETAVATFQEEARLAVEKFTDTHTRLVALQSELAVGRPGSGACMHACIAPLPPLRRRAHLYIHSFISLLIGS